MRQVGQVCCLWNQERRQLWGGQEDNTALFGALRENKQIVTFKHNDAPQVLVLKWKQPI